MNIGKYIFAQFIDFIPHYQFDKLVKKYKGDWHAKDLTCYNQLLHLLFGQITGCDSIRDICLWGYSENAVRTHLWVAIIAYLIIAKIKADYKSPYSITEVATLIRISALERVDLRDLITKPKDSIIQNQNAK